MAGSKGGGASKHWFDVAGWLKAFGTVAKQIGPDATFYALVVILSFILLCWQPPLVGLAFLALASVLWQANKVANCLVELHRGKLALATERERRAVRLVEYYTQQPKQLSFSNKDDG